MGNTFRNITMLLAFATVAFGGYYLFTQSTAQNDTQNSEAALQEMLQNTSVFIAYSQDLSRINFDMSLFEDERFRSLQTYTDPLSDQPVGQESLFSSSSE